MKLISGTDMAHSLRELAPSRIAAFRVDLDWRSHIDAGVLEELVVSPLDADPAVLAELAERLGWDKVHFLDTLRTRIYLGEHTAIGSINMETVAPGSEGQHDAGFLAHLPDMVAQLAGLYEGYRARAIAAYPTNELKQERLARLRAARDRALTVAALARAVAIGRSN